MKRMVCLMLLTTIFSVNADPLKIGIQPYDPPFAIQVNDKHQFTGFEAELVTEICKRLKTDCLYVPLTLDEFFPQLLAHSIDLAIGQISITLEREKQFLFSIPYMGSNGQFITTADSPIKQVKDMQGGKIGIFKGSFYKKYLLQQFNEQIDIVEYATTPQAFHGLLNNDVDALLLDSIDEDYWISNNNIDRSKFYFIGKPIPFGSGYGIMANLESIDLITNINKILISMESDGRYLQIYNLYFGSMNQISTISPQ